LHPSPLPPPSSNANPPDSGHTRSYLPSAIQRRGRQLLNQQCWLWGLDVKRADGNLLLLYGFERLRPPIGESGSSQYTLTLSGDLRVMLWGFGMYFGGKHGIYLNRFDFVPRSAEPAGQWQAQAMTSLPRCKDRALLPATLRWIGDYERWVASTAGLPYRRSCLQDWKISTVPAALLANAWHDLAREIDAWLSHNKPTRTPSTRHR
jgi:hypothetical protein